MLCKHGDKHGFRGATHEFIKTKTVMEAGGCYPSMETSMDFRVLLMDLSERRAVIVVGGCYLGMETSMDFGVLVTTQWLIRKRTIIQ